jgi:hypothetical protein
VKDNELIAALESSGSDEDFERARYLGYLQSLPIILHNAPRFWFRDEKEDED